MAGPLVDPTTPAGVQPRGLSGFGEPVFTDEFTAPSLDTSKWYPWYPDVPFWNQTQPGGHKTNSNEPQGYDETGISFPGNGIMKFTMRQENHAVPELPYTSGMVSSGDKFSQMYGVFEARIKVPREAGSWAAFWLFPAVNQWEYEIDILENWGADSWNVTSLHSVHTKLVAAHSEGYNHGEDVGINWHTYTLWWEPGRIRMFVDGNLALDYDEADIQYIYNKPMYVQLNLAGVWGTDLPKNVPFDMDVAYVRVWENNPSGAVNPGYTPPVEPDGSDPGPDPEPEPEPQPGTYRFYNKSGQVISLVRRDGSPTQLDS